MSAYPSLPFMYRYERKLRDERQHVCEYCGRAAVYSIQLERVDEGGIKYEDVCNIHFDEHYSARDLELVGVLRELGAHAAGRWGADYE